MAARERRRKTACYALASWKEFILSGLEPDFEDIASILYYIREAE